MMKVLISSLAVLVAGFAYAAPSFQSVPCSGSEEVVAVPSDEQNSIVDNKKPNGDAPQSCGCNKTKKGKK